MSNDVKKTPCTRCAYRIVCKHKDDFLKAIQAVNEATIAVNYDCVSDISVTCRYRQPEVATPREGIF